MRARPRPPGFFKVSSHQCNPVWLAWLNADYGDLTLDQARARLRERLVSCAPAAVVEAYDLLVRTKLHAAFRAERDALEEQVQPYVEWICQHGESVGAHTPTVPERARLFVLYELIELLLEQRPHHISLREAFDAIGNAFDRRMWLELVDVPVEQFCRGAAHQRRRYPGSALCLTQFIVCTRTHP